MRKFLSTVLLAALTLGVAGCGSGDGAFQTPGGDGGSATVDSISVSAATSSVPADGSDNTVITATARDANNAAVSGVAVTFASTAGGTVVVTQGTTDDSGVATATLTSDGAAAGSTITVTASAGTISSTVDVDVVDTQQTITVITSSPQIPSNSSTSSDITALVRGANNQFLEGVTVTFQASSGGLTVTQAVTDATGAAKATLNAAGDPTNRTITVTASAGSASATVPVEVTGTALKVTGPDNLVLGAAGTYTVVLTDSANQGIANEAITLTSANGNTLSSSTVTTDSTGQKTFTVTAAASGADTITASALGLTAGKSISVSNQSFAFTTPDPGTDVDVGDTQTITLHWESSGTPVADGTSVTFATTRGTLSPSNGVATTTGGNASVTITSSTSGPAIISATGTGVTTSLAINFVATVPDTVALQASPSTIPTDGQSTITAIVRDAANNLVEGHLVDFVLTDITGGGLTVASATTDSQGRAQTVYEASSTPSSSNGVSVKATVRGTAVLPATTTLTVGGQTVFLTLGTGNTIRENDSKTQFILPYLVQATDSSGHPVDGVNISLTIHSVPPTVIGDDTAYGKGVWTFNGTRWQQDGTDGDVDGNGDPIFTSITTCANEDGNLNGVLDAGEDTTGDGNGNGVLDPGDPAIAVPGSVVTAGGGTADFTVRYPEDHANWVRVRLTATATVQGTETSTSAIFWLPILADYLNSQTIEPPGRISPYGTATTCSDPN